MNHRASFPVHIQTRRQIIGNLGTHVLINMQFHVYTHHWSTLERSLKDDSLNMGLSGFEAVVFVIRQTLAFFILQLIFDITFKSKDEEKIIRNLLEFESISRKGADLN